jgi:cytochrome P450
MVARPFDHALQGISRRFTNPLWKLAETITPEGRSVRHDIKAVRAICRAFVQETVAELGNEQVGEKSVHEGRALFIRALMDSTKPMTMDELADSCTVFIIAGECER